jgi:hypothetical protein
LRKYTRGTLLLDSIIAAIKTALAILDGNNSITHEIQAPPESPAFVERRT